MKRAVACFFVLLSLSLITVRGQANSPCDFGQDSLNSLITKSLEQKDWTYWNSIATQDQAAQTLIRGLHLPCTLHDTLVAQVHHRLGILAQTQGQDFRAALSYYAKALKMRLPHLPDTHPDIVKGYNNMGVCYLQLTKVGKGFFLDSAETLLKQSIALNQARSQPTFLLGRSYLHLSRVMGMAGDDENTYLYLSAAIEKFSLDSTQPLMTAIAHNDAAILLANQLDIPQEGIFHAQKALSIYDGISLPLPTYHQNNLIEWKISLALAYLQLDSLSAASQTFEEVMSHTEGNREGQRPNIFRILNNQAIIANRQGTYQEALSLLREARALYPEGADPLQAGIHDNLGDAHTGLGQFDSALIAYQKAITYFSTDFASLDPQDNPSIRDGIFYDPQGLIRVMASKARTYLTMAQSEAGSAGDLLHAYRSYRAVDSMIHRLRQSYYTSGSKQALVSLTKPIYEKAIETCLLLYAETGESGYQQTAFSFAENSKAVILWDAVSQTRDIRTLLNPEEQAQLKRIQERKVYYEKSLATNAESELALRDSIIRYRQLEADFLDQLKAAHPQSGDLLANLGLDAWAGGSPMESLGADQALIEYFVGEENLYVFLLTQHELKVIQLVRDFPLQGWVEELRYAIHSDEALDDPQQYIPLMYQRAAQLYEKLVAPLGPLEDLPPRLTIVRDDILELVPFGALVTGDAEDISGPETAPYLLREKVISYAFSARLRRTFQQNRVRPTRRFLYFAPIEFNQLDLGDGMPLPPLPQNQGNWAMEAQELSHYTHGQATLGRFLSEADRYAVLYLASHGIFNEDDPRFNGIAFYDSVLYTADLYPLVLNAELVVLSTCESGAGKLIPGEGIISLGHGFARTGVRSVLSTQWKIINANSILDQFMANLKAGLPKDVALREAQLASLDQSFPFTWAAYEIRGDQGPIDFPRPNPLEQIPMWMLIMGVALLIGGGYWWATNRKG